MKVHWKWWGTMSRILHLIDMGLRYGRSKGVREYRLEEPPLTHLAAPSDLEESASHHYVRPAVNCQPGYLRENSHNCHNHDFANLKPTGPCVMTSGFVVSLPCQMLWYLKPALNRQPMFPRWWPEELAEFSNMQNNSCVWCVHLWILKQISPHWLNPELMF